jgi:hypothetical protein
MKRQVTCGSCWGVNQSWLVNEEVGHPEEVDGEGEIGMPAVPWYINLQYSYDSILICG